MFATIIEEIFHRWILPSKFVGFAGNYFGGCGENIFLQVLIQFWINSRRDSGFVLNAKDVRCHQYRNFTISFINIDVYN